MSNCYQPVILLLNELLSNSLLTSKVRLLNSFKRSLFNDKHLIFQSLAGAGKWKAYKKIMLSWGIDKRTEGKMTKKVLHIFIETVSPVNNSERIVAICSILCLHLTVFLLNVLQRFWKKVVVFLKLIWFRLSDWCSFKRKLFSSASLQSLSSDWIKYLV